MSKFIKLWEQISKSTCSSLTLSFDEIESIAGAPIDHSFLTYKKELTAYGWDVEKISMKQQTVRFKKV